MLACDPLPPALPNQQDAKTQADSLLRQQRVFEDALAQNDATHMSRLNRVKAESNERAAHQADAAADALISAARASRVFEDTLHNSNARLRRLQAESDERAARQADAAAEAVVAAAAAALDAQERQANAAVAAVAAAGIHAQTQQASAMAAQAAMFLEAQVSQGWATRRDIRYHTTPHLNTPHHTTPHSSPGSQPYLPQH